MMSIVKAIIIRFAACSIFLLISVSDRPGWQEARAEGGGQAKIGYLYLDEQGNQSVNRETFNLYEGPVLSFENLYYSAAGGLNWNADLKNLSLQNRDIQTSLSKSGLFGLALYNNQYRRIYSFDGDKYTRRRTAGGQGHYYVRKYFKLFGGFARTDRYGESQYIAPPYGETIPFSADYNHTSFNIGSQAFIRKGNLRLEYRRFDFSDNTSDDNNRESGNFRVDLYTPFPLYEKLALSAGYRHRRDLHIASAAELKTDQGWLGTRLSLAQATTVEYRFMAARSDHNQRPIEIDNYVNSINAGRIWPGRGGIRLGYENRISDDILNRTVSNGILFSGWFKHRERLTLRGRFSARKKEVKEGVTLIGDEDYTRHRIQAGYRLSPWGDLSLEYQRRVRINDDIDTRADYDAFTAVASLEKKEYGRLDLTYSYYLGTYENRSPDQWRRFEFCDHVLTGAITLAEYRRTRWSFGGTYYRSLRDRDIEKISGYAAVKYLISDGYAMEARYQVFNHDDFMILNNYYTGNIVEISLIKEFKF